MSDFFEKVKGQVDPFKKLLSYIPGFKGYVERQSRRDADKILRDTVALRFEELWKRSSALQVELGNNRMYDFIDDMEKASTVLRTFVDRISKAARGYSGLFDAVQINEKELEAIYQFDLAFFELGDEISRALDNVEATLKDMEGLPAAIRNLTSIARKALETFDRRSEVVTGSGQ